MINQDFLLTGVMGRDLGPRRAMAEQGLKGGGGPRNHVPGLTGDPDMEIPGRDRLFSEGQDSQL